MLGHIFYIFGLLVFILNLSILLNYTKIFNTKIWIEKFKKVTGNPPSAQDFRSKDEQNLYVSANAISVVDFLWLLLGLVTNSWSIFMSLLVFQFLFRGFLNMVKFEPVQKYFGILFQVFKILVILALVLNHFHFHLNWTDLL